MSSLQGCKSITNAKSIINNAGTAASKAGLSALLTNFVSTGGSIQFVSGSDSNATYGNGAAISSASFVLPFSLFNFIAVFLGLAVILKVQL